MPVIILSENNERELETTFSTWSADPYYYKLETDRNLESGVTSIKYTKTDLVGTVTVNETQLSQNGNKFSLMVRYTVS